jgi:hypothetical protein
MMSRTRRTILTIAATAALLIPSAAAFANPAPPTEGGNGAGASGQCTGQPLERPPVCPATD